jgi:hypothetical protein
MKKPTVVVYTAQVGGLDPSREDVLCFTNQRGFKESRRAARMYKALSHRYVDADYSIWIDSILRLKVQPEDLLPLLNGKDIAVMRHPTNVTIYEEAEDVKRAKLDNLEIVDSQMSYYRSQGYESIEGMAMTGLIIRKHTKKIEDLNNAWWSEICAGSGRDQLSFNYVFDGHISYIDWPGSYDNEYFYTIKHRISILRRIKSVIRIRTRLKLLKSIISK